MRKIVTRNVFPPIPVRSFDWCAYYEGEDEAGNYGWGCTEADAIEDFNENCREDHDERLAAWDRPTPETEMIGTVSVAADDTRMENSNG